MVEPTCNPSCNPSKLKQKLKQTKQTKVVLGYTESSRLAWASCNPVSANIQHSVPSAVLLEWLALDGSFSDVEVSQITQLPTGFLTSAA